MIQQVTGILFDSGGQAILLRDPQKTTWRHTRHVSAFLSSKSGCKINMPRRYNVLPTENKAHMYKLNSQLNSSNIHIRPGIPSEILFGICSGILIPHSYLTFFLRFF